MGAEHATGDAIDADVAWEPAVEVDSAAYMVVTAVELGDRVEPDWANVCIL